LTCGGSQVQVLYRPPKKDAYMGVFFLLVNQGAQGSAWGLGFYVVFFH
jgi:hypothetical protein